MDDILILWDIDGTLNVHGKANHWSGQWITNTVTRQECPALFEHFPQKFDTINLRVNEALLVDFSSLTAPHITHQWLSAWEQDAATLFAPRVGFAAGQSWKAICQPGEETEIWWKTEAVRTILEAHPARKVIWVDDLLDSTEIIEDNNRQLNEDFPGQLAMVGVTAHHGVTPDVMNFVRNLAKVKWQAGMFIFEQ